MMASQSCEISGTPLSKLKKLDTETKRVIESIISQHAHLEGAMLPILHAVQDSIGYIPEAAIEVIARKMNLSRAEVHGIISFYHDFRTQPTGQTTIHLCRAEACQAMGSRALETHVKAKLSIEFGQVTADGRFALEPVYCLGNCACSPSIRIGDATYARVSPERFDQLLEQAKT